MTIDQKLLTKMTIGFDGKRLYDNKTGLGNYSRTLVEPFVAISIQKKITKYLYIKNTLKTVLTNIKEYVDDTIVSDAFSADLWRFKGVEEDIFKHGIDIYHGLSNEVPDLPQPMKKVVTIHDVIFQKLPKTFPFIDRQMYAYKTKKACHIADAIVAVSEQTKQDLIELFKVPEEKIHVIYPTWNKEYEHDCKYVLKEEYFAKIWLATRFCVVCGRY
jgi:glycosyltransferase involved in cell wall biosynthesis